MNESFEMIRSDLKKFNAEDNHSPPKLVVAGNNDFLDLEHKRRKNSQFIISVKQYHKTEKPPVDSLLAELELRTGRMPLAFFYDQEEIIKAVIADFEDYYNMRVSKDLFQKIGSPATHEDLNFCLVIAVIETDYFTS